MRTNARSALAVRAAAAAAAAHRAGLPRSAAGPARIAVPRPAPLGKARLAPGHLGRIRERPPSQILPAVGERAKTIADRRIGMEPSLQSDRAGASNSRIGVCDGMVEISFP